MLGATLKSGSSMKFQSYLYITQKSAWFLGHGLQYAFSQSGTLLAGLIEVGEACFGGKHRNMPSSKRESLEGCGAVGKTPVVGTEIRARKKVAGNVVTSSAKCRRQISVKKLAGPRATVYTDDARAYDTLPRNHEAAKHLLSKYVTAERTDGIESRWSMLKRAHRETFHQFSPKHPDCYGKKFASHHNVREKDTIEQMSTNRSGIKKKRVRYAQFIASKGLASGAQV